MEALNEFLGVDWHTAGIILFNLILIESLLSVDNAAVLATMVMKLPEHQRGRALRYGIIGAYVFRGLSLVFVSLLLKFSILKLLGGLFLLWLTVKYFLTKATPDPEDDLLKKEESFIYRMTIGKLGLFWSTVLLVEFMDLSFSIDNVFAAVALVENIPRPQSFYIVCLGVFIGILAMRFAAQGFVTLMGKFPFLEALAFIVIGILGVKLCSSYLCEFYPETGICVWLGGHTADLIISLITAGIFILPVLTSMAFNFPKRAEK